MSFTICDPRLGDMVKIRSLHESYYKNEFEFPNRDEMNEIKIVRNERNEILGCGIIRPINEVIMILDKSKSRKTKINVLKHLLSETPQSQIHAFVQDDSFASILQNHFDFRPTKGQALIR